MVQACSHNNTHTIPQHNTTTHSYHISYHIISSHNITTPCYITIIPHYTVTPHCSNIDDHVYRPVITPAQYHIRTQHAISPYHELACGVDL